MTTFQSLIPAATLAIAVGSATGADGGSARTVRAHQPPITAGRFVAPSGKFAAIASYGEGEVVAVRIIRSSTGGKTVAMFEDATGFMWLPNRGDTLVVSTCNSYSDQAGLYLWSPSRGPHRIAPLKRTPSRWDECYWLRASAPDGRTLIYSHCKMRPSSSSRNWNGEWERQRTTLRRLKLR